MSSAIHQTHTFCVEKSLGEHYEISNQGDLPIDAQLAGLANAAPWKLHVIDHSSRGADGVKLADFNQDGRLDLITAWEEGGLIRLYLQPELDQIEMPWPLVTVGKVKSPEDAFFADLDTDGQFEIVSCCEGKQQAVFVHHAPKDSSELLNAKAWKTAVIPDSVNKTRWMFGLAANLDTDPEIELLCGSKNPHGQIGFYNLPTGTLNDATWEPIVSAGWIMSLIRVDADQDGDQDLVYSDRKGPHRGCWCRLNPGNHAHPADWPEMPIGGQGHEVMFLSNCDANEDGLPDFVAPLKQVGIQLYQQYVNTENLSGSQPRFETTTIPFPKNVGSAKCAVLVDVNLNGELDLVASCEQAEGQHGCYWLSDWQKQNRTRTAQFHEISGRNSHQVRSD